MRWLQQRATPLATTQPITKDFPALPQSFFARPAELVGPELIGCRLVKRQEDCSLLWGVVVETEAYSEEEPATRGYRRRSPQNKTLFGEPGRLPAVSPSRQRSSQVPLGLKDAEAIG